MRWTSAIVIGVTTGIVGTVLASLMADVATRAHGVSNFEGGRGYLVVFVFAPLGLILGLVVGIWLTRASGAANFPALALQQLIAIIITAGIIGTVGGASILMVNKPPLIDGDPLALEFEIRLPATDSLPADSADSDLRVSLFAGDNDNAYATLHFSSAGVHDGAMILPGTSPLNSHSARRMLLVGHRTGDSQVFDINLEPTPRAADEAWSKWTEPTPRADGKNPGTELQYRVRCEWCG